MDGTDAFPGIYAITFFCGTNSNQKNVFEHATNIFQYLKCQNKPFSNETILQPITKFFFGIFWMSNYPAIGSVGEGLLHGTQYRRILPHNEFYAWVFINNFVYQVRVKRLRDLRHRIMATVERITPEILTNTWQEID